MRARLIAIAFLLGCGGDGVDIDTDQNNVCSEIAEVACHNMYQCCTEGEIEDFLGVGDPRTEAQCRDDVRSDCVRQIASLDFAVDEKRVRFDAEIMNDCLDALVAPSDTCATIETTLPWDAACMNSAWIGLVADGGRCLASLECASEDSFCGANQTCIARPGDGQPCGAAGCATGLFCSAGTCRPQLAAGGACTSTNQCLEGLFCDTDAAPAVCAERRAIGEACTSSAACASDRCNPGLCARNGQTCFADNDCFGGACADDNSLCTFDGDCAPGRCSVSGAACSAVTPCAGAGETCVFPVRCNPPDCVGDVVCSERFFLVDYCDAAFNELPISN
jgi:hypothetical protein